MTNLIQFKKGQKLILHFIDRNLNKKLFCKVFRIDSVNKKLVVFINYKKSVIFLDIYFYSRFLKSIEIIK